MRKKQAITKLHGCFAELIFDIHAKNAIFLFNGHCLAMSLPASVEIFSRYWKPGLPGGSSDPVSFRTRSLPVQLVPCAFWHGGLFCYVTFESLPIFFRKTTHFIIKKLKNKETAVAGIKANAG